MRAKDTCLYLEVDSECCASQLRDFQSQELIQETDSEFPKVQVQFCELVVTKCSEIKVWAQAACDLEVNTPVRWANFSLTLLYKQK